MTDIVPIKRGGYVARISGPDPKFRLEREFMRARAHHRGGRKTYGVEVTRPGIYEIRDGNGDGIDARNAIALISGAIDHALANPDLDVHAVATKTWDTMQPRDKGWHKYDGTKWTELPHLGELARRLNDDDLASLIETGANRLGWLDFCCLCGTPVEAITSDGWPACADHEPTLAPPAVGYSGPDLEGEAF